MVGGQEHHGVSDVEIRIAGRETLAITALCAKAWGVSGRAVASRSKAAWCEAAGVEFERLVVGVVFVLLHDGDDGIWADKSRDIVDMPVRVIALDAIAEPED